MRSSKPLEPPDAHRTGRYISAFASDPIVFSKVEVSLVLCYTCCIYAVLYPHLDPGLIFPVLCYAGAIGAMAIFSLSRRPPSVTSWRFGAFGAFVFIISDSVLAINKFVVPVPHAADLIMTTYYSGQLLIALSARSASARPGKAG